MKLYAIRDKRTNTFLCAHPKGYGHTQVDLNWVDKPNTTPRLFRDKDTARRALTMWLRGVIRNHYEDGMEEYDPKIKRNKEEMEVVEITLRVM